jgi:hypothetical protein
MKKFIPALFISVALLSACGGSGSKKDDKETGKQEDKKESTSSGDELISSAAAPAGFTFERKDFEGMGTAEFPSGADWEVENNTWYNEKLDMTVKTQSHASADMSLQADEYLESYDDVNKRDAPQWKRSSKQPGSINGMPGARVEGTFNNGTAYVVRDYLFFTPNKTAIIQCRIAEKDKDKLNGVVDYIASTFKK